MCLDYTISNKKLTFYIYLRLTLISRLILPSVFIYKCRIYFGHLKKGLDIFFINSFLCFHQEYEQLQKKYAVHQDERLLEHTQQQHILYQQEQQILHQQIQVRMWCSGNMSLRSWLE